MAARPSASPGPTHQENISTSVLAGALVATGAMVAVGRMTGTAGAWVATGAGAAVVAAPPQADRTSMTAINRLKTVKPNFFDNISFSLFLFKAELGGNRADANFEESVYIQAPPSCYFGIRNKPFEVPSIY
jgi:hypothetical protein